MQQPPSTARFHGIDLVQRGDIMPDDMGGWRIFIWWGWIIVIIWSLGSLFGALGGFRKVLNSPWGFGLPFAFLGVVALSIWLWKLWSAAALRKQQLATTQTVTGNTLQLTAADIAPLPHAESRLRLIGNAEDLSRILALVQARVRFEPVIAKPQSAACFPKDASIAASLRASKSLGVDDAVDLVTHGGQRFVVYALAAGLVLGAKFAIRKLGYSIDFGFFTFALIAGLGTLALEWLVPTYLRISPQRLDIMTFVPKLLTLAGGAQARAKIAVEHTANTTTNTPASESPQAQHDGHEAHDESVVCTTYNLASATITIDTKRGVARVLDSSRSHRPLVFIRAGRMIVRSKPNEAQVWAALLTAALSHVQGPTLPTNRLTD